MVLLSARSAQGLERAAGRLAAHLGEHAELDLADVASTLHRGRKAFGHRRAIVCRDRAEAIALLSDAAAEGVLTGVKEREDTGVAFLFPGLGDQQLQMAREIYRAEPGFRADVDRSCELLAPVLGVDLREVLYPAEEAAKELERCVKTLRFKGVQILTNVAGKELSDPAFAPFWRKAEELNALVVLHPNGFTEAQRLSLARSRSTPGSGWWASPTWRCRCCTRGR